MTQLKENVAKEGIPGTVAKKYFHGNASPLKEFNTAEFARKGTGGMSQGWGHYITESESVGKHYAEITGGKKGRFYLGDEEIRPSLIHTDLDAVITNIPAEERNAMVAEYKARDEQWIRNHKDTMHPDSYNYMKERIGFYDRLLNSSEPLRREAPKFLHEISIPEDMQFIPWDEPLQKDMAMKIGGALKDYNEVLRERWPKYDVDFTSRYAGGNFTGGDMYREISKQFGGDKQASEFLSSIGIDGNKYKGDTGKGDYYNYVIFDDKKSKVIKSTMLASLMAALIGRDKIASPPRENSY